ncbi:hypothetical protein cpbgf_500886 [Cryptosporidium parvum]|uniref:Dolichol-phosphate mannosyltransferase subunit 3 n=1 Tax=Cryptosporidium parvum TaxID=5807 RepID=A0A7S7LH18_CRYPV|nr:hypothetical protein CPATCC_0022690 [Cryptosporidium parvum]WRK32234.1 hypothetical protein cpbgf_500886 [Cryptosporidium parvum]|eukprot:QOY41523.1 hypothetical protein CPATCC_002087 [Cryptosporidium parvum]
MERKIKDQLPYFGYGKKVVSILLFSVFVWIFGLFHFGTNSKNNTRVYWIASPFVCLLGFGLYSVISISISLLQFSNVSNGKADLAEDILRAQANLEKRGFKLD